MDFRHVLFTFRPLSTEEKNAVASASRYLSRDDSRRLSFLVKRKECSVEIREMPYSKAVTEIVDYPVCKASGAGNKRDADYINRKINQALDEKIQESFSGSAFEKTASLIAPKIIGFEDIKKAAALQLFASDPYHILLLGDPGTGKTDILRAVESLSPISSFGLGSGTSNTGLTITASGNEVRKGILSLADGGIALIDELNLMKKEDRAGLYNAMEKGFVTYDKGGHHYKFPANCSLLASANPKKDAIIGHDIFGIRKQVPFDLALLSRFHLVFLVRRQDIKEFMEIADELLSGRHKETAKQDEEFIRNYVENARKINVVFPEKFNDEIKSFVLKVRKKEQDLLYDITPRFIIGLKRLIEASARAELRNRVEKKDVERVIGIYASALKAIGF